MLCERRSVKSKTEIEVKFLKQQTETKYISDGVR
jgi:hypothetical protein